MGELEELFSLFKILDIYNENHYDALIVDCAPSGETLSLLKYPEKLSEMFDRILPMKRQAVKLAGQAIEKLDSFAPKEELDLKCQGNEMTLSVKNEVRRFPIPSGFSEEEIISAKYEENYLNICFQKSKLNMINIWGGKINETNECKSSMQSLRILHGGV